ncbi:MAG TPA: OmpH family outer membrane protein [Bryobacteraceae bacterium]|nr:OmpH family outer membrane protein [Bryobacteraceae bacterium]
MKLPGVVYLCFWFTGSAAAQTPPPGRTAVLQVQNGILRTREGLQAFSDLEGKYSARNASLEKLQNDINALQEQLRKGGAAMSDDAQRKVARDIDRKSKALNYQAETTRAEYEQEQADLMQSLARKFHGIVEKYAKDKDIGIVVDIGNPQTPAFWWASALDLTNDVVKAYDAAYPAAVKPEH